MRLSVNIQGVEDATARISADAVGRAMQTAIEHIGEDLATSKGGGLAVQVNSLSVAVSSNLAVVESSLIWPRTTGESWLARSQLEGESVALTALEAAGEQLAQEMA